MQTDCYKSCEFMFNETIFMLEHVMWEKAQNDYKLNWITISLANSFFNAINLIESFKKLKLSNIDHEIFVYFHNSFVRNLRCSTMIFCEINQANHSIFFRIWSSDSAFIHRFKTRKLFVKKFSDNRLSVDWFERWIISNLVSRRWLINFWQNRRISIKQLNFSIWILLI